MKIAILMTGHFRTLPLCWPKMRAMFDGHELDITVLCSEPEKVIAFHEIVKPNRLLLIQEPTKVPDWVPERLYKQPAHLSGVMQAVKELEVAPVMEHVRMNWRPDMVCRLRPDLEITTPLEPLEDLNNQITHFPKFNNWGGINGQFLIGYPAFVLGYFERARTFEEYAGDPGDEKFLAWRTKDWPIARSRIKFNLLRENGTREKPNYSSGGDIPEEKGNWYDKYIPPGAKPIKVGPDEEIR